MLVLNGILVSSVDIERVLLDSMVVDKVLDGTAVGGKVVIVSFVLVCSLVSRSLLACAVDVE